MYMVLWWKENDYLDCVKNENGSIRLWEKLENADKYANNHEKSDDMRVITIEQVHE